MSDLKIVPTKFNPKSTVEGAQTIEGDDIADFIKLYSDELNENKGIYKRGGWRWDFRPHLKRFIVNRYHQWETMWFVSLEVAKQYIEKIFEYDDDENPDFGYYEIYELPREPQPENLPNGY